MVQNWSSTKVLYGLGVGAELQLLTNFAGDDPPFFILLGVEQNRLRGASTIGDREWREGRLWPALMIGDVFLGVEIAWRGVVAGMQRLFRAGIEVTDLELHGGDKPVTRTGIGNGDGDDEDFKTAVRIAGIVDRIG